MAKKLYEYVEKTGVIVPDTAELRQGVESEWRALFGPDLLLTPESPEGVVVTAETEARDAVVRNNAAVANQINPNLAGGVFLDSIAALTGLVRRRAEPSLVIALLRGVPSTIIPAGVRVKTEAGDEFASKKAVVLDETGRAETYFYSAVQDSVPCPAGSLTEIQDGVLGWETITNPGPAVLGQTVENDVLFRRRRRQTLFLQGIALPQAITSALYDVPGVSSVVYRENFTSAPKNVDGKTLAPHSIYVCVDGGENEAVAAALHHNKSGGCGWNGGTTVPVQDTASGQTYFVQFDRPELVPVLARYTVKQVGSAVADVQLACRDATLDYAAGLLDGMEGFCVGGAVSPFELAAAVNMCAPGLFVLLAEVALASVGAGALRAETLPIAIWQKPTITAGSISVVGA